jgi:hypothetical protein
MIWRETFGPRILHITGETDSVIWQLLDRPHVWFKSREKSPIALQICYESRALALKHYTPSFHPTTSPLTRASESEMKQTAHYFSPELDTVHIADDQHGSELYKISCRTDKETILSIKTLAIGSQLFPDMWTLSIAARLPPFRSLETLILVVGDETGWDGEGSSIRVNMETYLATVKDRLVLKGNCVEWKLPAVKVTTLRAFENDL